MPPLAPCHLQQVGDLTQPLTSCSTQENGPWSLPGHHHRAEPINRVSGEQALNWYSLPRLWCGGGGKRKMLSPLLPPADEGVDPPLYEPQHSGK